MKKSNGVKIKYIVLNLFLLAVFVALSVTSTYAYVVSRATVRDNYFATSTIKLGDINDSKPIFEEEELHVVAPGYAVQKEIEVVNTGSADFFFRIYFTDITGDAAPAFRFEFFENGIPAFTQTADKLQADIDPYVSRDVLRAGTNRTVTIKVTYVDDGKIYANDRFDFAMVIEAVQERNNSDEYFH